MATLSPSCRCSPSTHASVSVPEPDKPITMLAPWPFERMALRGAEIISDDMNIRISRLAEVVNEKFGPAPHSADRDDSGRKETAILIGKLFSVRVDDEPGFVNSATLGAWALETRAGKNGTWPRPTARTLPSNTCCCCRRCRPIGYRRGIWRISSPTPWMRWT